MINDILFDVCDTINKQFAEDRVECTAIPNYSGYVEDDYTHKITEVFYGILLIFPEALYARHTLAIVAGRDLQADQETILYTLHTISIDEDLYDTAVRLLKPTDFAKRWHLTATLHSLQRSLWGVIKMKNTRA